MGSTAAGTDFYVYEHWRPDTGQCFYVGKGHAPKRAYDLKTRSAWHRRVTRKLSGLGMAIEVRIVSAGLNEAEAFVEERRRILTHRAAGIELVNMTDGGEGASGAKHSPEVRAKMAAAARRRNENPEYSERQRAAAVLAWTKRERKPKARRPPKPPREAKPRAPISAETREKMAAAKRGKKRTEEQRSRMREARARHPLSDEARARIGAAAKGRKPRLGQTVGPETREIMRLNGLARIELFRQFAHLGPKASARPVVCVSDGQRFASASDAARHYGAQKSSIIELCNGNPRRKTVAGLMFKYEEAA